MAPASSLFPPAAIIAKIPLVPHMLKAELFQNVLAAGVFNHGVRIDRPHAQNIKGVSKGQPLRLRPIAPALYPVVLHMDAEGALPFLPVDLLQLQLPHRRAAL